MKNDLDNSNQSSGETEPDKTDSQSCGTAGEHSPDNPISYPRYEENEEQMRMIMQQLFPSASQWDINQMKAVRQAYANVAVKISATSAQRAHDKPKSPKKPLFTVLYGKTCYEGVPVSDMHAYPLNVAAALLGIKYQTLWNYIRMGKLRMSPGKLIARDELKRFLSENGQNSRKRNKKEI